jgi:hypothetical protein
LASSWCTPTRSVCWWSHLENRGRGHTLSGKLLESLHLVGARLLLVLDLHPESNRLYAPGKREHDIKKQCADRVCRVCVQESNHQVPLGRSGQRNECTCPIIPDCGYGDTLQVHGTQRQNQSKRTFSRAARASGDAPPGGENSSFSVFLYFHCGRTWRIVAMRYERYCHRSPQFIVSARRRLLKALEGMAARALWELDI